MNRIDQKFQELRQKGKTAFIAYLTAGYPDLKTTEQLVPALAEAGADIIELGVPFSDPLADGPTIQSSSYQALEQGVTFAKLLVALKRIRKQTQVPIALMTYFNPVFHYGEARCVRDVQQAGGDGLIIPDLPPEEAGTLIQSARASQVATVFFLSPTTTAQRMPRIIRASTGFIYYVSIAGVTGARTSLPKSLRAKVRQARAMTDKPVCVGFGISRPEQVREVAGIADGVIVGSAIIKEIERFRKDKDLVNKVSGFVRRLAAGMNSCRIK